ncbi:MAG: hypothetical protein WC736_14715 [Gallionella sp.]|jgi:hypothetical protein
MTTYTEDVGEIMQCSRERHLVADILNAWNTGGLPDTFDASGAKFAFNSNSGNVFLVNDDYQCAMMNGDALAVFYSTPYDGLEGFIGDLLTENDPSAINAEDAEYILRAAHDEGAELPEVWQAFGEKYQDGQGL